MGSIRLFIQHNLLRRILERIVIKRENNVLKKEELHDTRKRNTKISQAERE